MYFTLFFFKQSLSQKFLEIQIIGETSTLSLLSWYLAIMLFVFSFFFFSSFCHFSYPLFSPADTHTTTLSVTERDSVSPDMSALSEFRGSSFWAIEQNIIRNWCDIYLYIHTYMCVCVWYNYNIIKKKIIIIFPWKKTYAKFKIKYFSLIRGT